MGPRAGINPCTGVTKYNADTEAAIVPQRISTSIHRIADEVSVHCTGHIVQVHHREAGKP